MATEREPPAIRFTAEMEYKFCLDWWTTIRLSDCGELVYRHAVGVCPCGRNQSEAYEAWRAQHPELAAAHDALHTRR